MGARITTITDKLSKLFSDDTLTKKALLNAVASTLDYGTRWLVTFFINPILVTRLGDFGYGAWQVMSRMITYISPAGGRPTQALKWTIASQQASTDYHEKRLQVGSAITVWFLFLPLLSILGAVLSWYMPVWLNAPLDLYLNLRWATALLVANLIFTNLAEVPQSVLRGENLGYKRMGLTTMFILLGGGLMALALLFNKGLIGLSIAQLITTVITGFVFYRLVRSYVQWFGIAKPIFSKVLNFLGLSWWFLAWSLVFQLLKAGDVVLLGVLDSAELVTHYSLTRFIPETIIGLIAIIVFGITPGLGGIIGSGNLEKTKRVRNEIMTLTWLIVTIFGSTMLLWNQSFVRIWVGEEYYAGTSSNLLIVIMITQFVFIRNDANFLDLTLDLRNKVLIGLISAGISAGLCVVLVGNFKLGIMGLTISFILGQIILSIGYPLLIGRLIGLSLISQLRGIIKPGLVTILFYGLVTLLSKSFNADSWLSLVLSTGITFLLLSLFVPYIGLTREQRGRLIKRIQKVLPGQS